MGLTNFIYNCLGTNLIENDTLQKNLIESFVCNIIVEYLFNNKEINNNILYSLKKIYLQIIKLIPLIISLVIQI